MLKGTASYIAPEIWDDVRAFSPASDAFALGTLLLELLVLDRLHAGGSMPQVYRRIVQGTAAEDASRLAPYLPPVVPLIEELLERDPKRRLGDLRRAALQLDLLLGTLPGPDDPSLLLRLLDSIEHDEDPPALPDRVDRAWQAVIEQATGNKHPLVAGPTGEDATWPLAVPSVPDASLIGCAPSLWCSVACVPSLKRWRSVSPSKELSTMSSPKAEAHASLRGEDKHRSTANAARRPRSRRARGGGTRCRRRQRGPTRPACSSAA